MSGYTNVTVDDSAEDTFQFDGTWFMLSTGSNSAVHNDTLSEATAPGTISYYFTGDCFRALSQSTPCYSPWIVGNQLWVYGTVSPTKPGKPPTAVTATFDISGRSIAGASGSFTAPNTTEEQDGVLLWTSGPVDVYGYYLLINVTSATPDYPFLFDYLVFSRPPEVTSDPFSQSSTTSSPTLSIPNALTLTSTSMSHDSESSSASLSSSQAQETNAAPPSSGHHTGAIVGGVVGGLAALILGMLLLWCTRRRMRAYPSDADLSGNLKFSLQRKSTDRFLHHRYTHARGPPCHQRDSRGHTFPSSSGLWYNVGWGRATRDGWSYRTSAHWGDCEPGREQNEPRINQRPQSKSVRSSRAPATSRAAGSREPHYQT